MGKNKKKIELFFIFFHKINNKKSKGDIYGENHIKM